MEADPDQTVESTKIEDEEILQLTCSVESVEITDEEIVRLACNDQKCPGHQIQRSRAELSPTLKNMLAGRSYGGCCTDEDEEIEDSIILYLEFVQCHLLAVVCDYLQYKFGFAQRDFSKPDVTVPEDFGMDLPHPILFQLFYLADFLMC